MIIKPFGDEEEGRDDKFILVIFQILRICHSNIVAPANACGIFKSLINTGGLIIL